MLTRWTALLLVALLPEGHASAAGPPATWAGLTRQTVAGIAKRGANEYTKLGAGPVGTTLARGTFQGHRAWIVKADFTCAGGHHPTIVVWSARSVFRGTDNMFMCRGARGLRVSCREVSVC